MNKITNGLFLAIFLIFNVNCFAQVPTQNLTVPGLTDAVTVRRDARSIPYIEAKNDKDLYFAQGYVTASDRLWQMDLLRRAARGETAEIFGEIKLEDDKRWRKLGFAGIVEKSLRDLSPDLKAALEDYARGVNAYIARLDENSMPVEFKILQYKPREWQPTDTLVIGKILSDGLSTTWYQDLLRTSIESLPKDKLADLNNNVTPADVVLFGKDTQAQPIRADNRNFAGDCFSAAGCEALLKFAERDEQVRRRSLESVGFYAEDLAASNNWVISGKRTIDGKPILANDPHLPPSAPGIWYLTHLSTPAMRVSGVTFPGVPGIVLGHNENIAWGATNVGPDVQDLYLEKFGADGKYQTPGGFAAPTIRKEDIKVRSNPLKPDTRTVSFDVIETRNGVIYAEDGANKYALKWTARDPANNEFEAFFKLNKARNYEDFKTSLKTYGGSMQNFVYADTSGNIGWIAAGRVPVRKSGDGSVIYDGATTDGEWTGMIPFEELPQLYNPPEGFIVTANQRIAGTDYKYFKIISRDAALPWRARRIYDALKANSKISMNDVRDVQFDVFNIPLSDLAREIVKLSAASPETLQLLRGWDGKMTADSKAATVTNEIRNCLANKIADENQPVPAAAVRERLLWWIIKDKSARWLPKTFADYPAFIKACDGEARVALSDPKRLGADENNWAWGNVFKSRLPHPLAGVPFIGAQFATPIEPLSGSGQTPNVGSNVSMRLIAAPGNWDETRHVIPLGESGDARSPFYKDQFQAWKTGTPAIFPFTKAAVEKATQNVVVMSSK